MNMRNDRCTDVIARPFYALRRNALARKAVYSNYSLSKCPVRYNSKWVYERYKSKVQSYHKCYTRRFILIALRVHSIVFTTSFIWIYRTDIQKYNLFLHSCPWINLFKTHWSRDAPAV